MRALWRILLAAGVMMAFGATFALGFDESGVDFKNQDLTTAYVALDNAGEGLTVLVAGTKIDGYVGTMDVEDMINDFDHDDFTTGAIASKDIVKVWGEQPWSPVAFPGLVALKGTASFRTMVQVKHNQPVAAVTEAYLTRLADLGYTITEEPVTSNITAYTLANGQETLRMIVARSGGDTTVTLTHLL